VWLPLSLLADWGEGVVTPGERSERLIKEWIQLQAQVSTPIQLLKRVLTTTTTTTNTATTVKITHLWTF